MNENLLARKAQETIDDFLWRLGGLKDTGVIQLTWPQIAAIMNQEIAEYHAPMDESRWRKRYRKLQFDHASDNANDDAVFMKINNADNYSQEAYEELAESNANVLADVPTNTEESVRQDDDSGIDEKALLGEKVKVQVRDERMALNRSIRNAARYDVLIDLFRSEINRYNGHPMPPKKKPVFGQKKQQAVYALLSDIHYGIAYNSSAGKYNSSIAKDRVMRYAEEIADIGELHDIDCCYVGLLGDMISGNIHSVIRVENKENVIEQIIGVSELIASFLYDLSTKFTEVHVNSVSGNHSRLDLNADDALRGDKLDELIPYYCRIKLAACPNIIWHVNEFDPTIAFFDIFGKTYVSVHGDYDNNLSRSAAAIERLIRKPIDYILAGHMHIPELRLETLGTIRNGSVCGSGDEYTVKKRLFSDPQQVCLVVDDTGIRDYIPVAL